MDPLNVTIVALLFAAAAFVEWADRRDLFSTWIEQAWVRFGRRVPPGWYEIEGEVGISFGKADTTIILRLPLRLSGAIEPVRYIAATDSSTRFSVNGQDATPDELLEAYDDSLGPLGVQVNEPGRIAEVGIAARTQPIASSRTGGVA